MDDMDLAQTLFMNAEGEVRSFPEYGATAQKRPDTVMTPVFPQPNDRIHFVTVVWQPVRKLPKPAQLAIARLYREREQARELTIDWYWTAFLGRGMQFPFSGQLHALVRRCRDMDWVEAGRDKKRNETYGR
jgi:hypothetical protein